MKSEWDVERKTRAKERKFVRRERKGELIGIRLTNRGCGEGHVACRVI